MEYFTKQYMTGPEGAHRRAVYKAMGFTDKDLSQPLIAVVNSWGEVCPGHFGLNMLTQKVKEGVWQAGATPVEFCTISQCGTLTLGLDGIRYDLATREMVAFDIETIVHSQMFDGIVFMTACDKVVPGMLIAAARLNLLLSLCVREQWRRAVSMGRRFPCRIWMKRLWAAIMQVVCPQRR